MPAYKTIDKVTGRVKSWYCSFKYRDYTGQNKRKVKRGFQTRAAALEWERNFLERLAASPDMTMRNLCRLYLDDMAARLKPTSIRTKKSVIENQILPTFGDTPVNAITPADIRSWQQKVMAAGLHPTYQRCIHRTLSAVFNYAVKFHQLTTNPARVAGPIGEVLAHRTAYWTPKQFAAFLLTHLSPVYCCLFSLLFWSGCRIGEALALTAEDVDMEHSSIRINKSFARIHGRDLIQSPKTPASNRTVTLPGFMMEILKDWIRYTDVKGKQRLFEGVMRTTASVVFHRHIEWAGLPDIRVHDLRHSHASLLVSIGCSPIVIKERLGHQSINTTINIYSHLFPTKQSEVKEKLEHLPL